MNRTCKAFLALLFSLLLVAMLNGREVTAESFADGWTQTYGGMNEDYAYALVQTGDGGYALAGGTRSFGVGWDDFWLVKTNSDGTMLWNKTFGGPDSDYATSVVQTSDGGYVMAGGTSSYGAGSNDLWFVKTDDSGNLLWNKTLGGRSSDGAMSVVQAADSGYALAGYTDSFGAGSSDFWLVKTDAGGNVLWNRTYGGPNFDYASVVVQTGDGGYALAGTTNSSGIYDCCLVKTDESGVMQWNKTYGGASVDWGYSAVQTSDGGYALAGYTDSFGAGAGDFWLIRTDSLGNVLWNRTFGGTNNDIAYSVVQTVDGGYALAGYTESFGAGSLDAWLVKTDADGVIPEFPSNMVSVAFMVSATLTVVLAKKKHREHMIQGY